MAIDPNRLTGVAISLFLAGAGFACGGTRPANAPTNAAATQTAHAARGAGTSAPGGPAARADGQKPGPRGDLQPPGQGSTQPDDAAGESDDDAELVVSRDVVAACPTLRLVRQHIGELDQDMVWLAVLEAIADCMGESGPMAEQNIGVSGDEDHRHIIREVLGTHGIAPTRVVAKPQSVEGAAECQGGAICGRRVEITILAP
jgi:hypothetical protein